MAEFPTGTVTFLFTDIQGSTELLTTLGDKYRDVLERHNELLRTAFARNDGFEIATEGDAFFVVFTRAPAAAQAALDGQRALSSEDWPAGTAVRVRMGLHTGEGVRGADSYVGLDVHRAARIATAAHGGQILVSDATRALLEQALPDGARLLDAGRHRLKGLPAAEHIFQLLANGLPSDFPRISSVDERPNNLPTALTSFVGREPQVAEIAERLQSARLLTMTGPGGMGKTRLGIRVAEEVIAGYEHGCWFVALAALRDPELVPATIADALGVAVPADRPALVALESWLANRHLLLVLDNFEHLTAAAAQVTRLLAAGPGIQVLVTSRVPLHVYGEHEYPVPPLASTSELRAAGLASPQALSNFEAVRLFVDRALAVKPDFRVTNANAPAVAEICARLDGLPLAIELAAARVKLLSPEQILSRLDVNLSLLSSPAQDVPQRQRTLRGAIDWSHDLLRPPEQRLFARLAIFRGGCSLDAAEDVCGSDDLDIEVLDGISSLVDNSLLRTVDGSTETRFAMLETIREYARERLAESSATAEVARRHAVYFFGVAHQAGNQLMGPKQGEWLDRLGREHDNLRAAFERAPELGMLDAALGAAGAMWRFWQLGGHFAEGRATLERLLERTGGSEAARAAALTGAGGLAYWQGDFEATARHYAEARQLFELMGNAAGLAEALYNESYVLLLANDLAGARSMLERSIAIYRDLGDELGATEAEHVLGWTHYMDGNAEQAVALAERVVATYRAAGARWMLADRLTGLAYVHGAAGNWDEATLALREALGHFVEMKNEVGLAMALEAAGSAAAWLGDVERGVTLLGKSDEMKERLGGGAPSAMFSSGAFRDRARSDVGEARFEELRASGMRLSVEEAVVLAEQFQPPAGAPPAPPRNFSRVES